MDENQRYEVGERIHNRILETINVKQKRVKLYYRWVVAASLICLLSVGVLVGHKVYSEKFLIHHGEHLFADFSKGKLILGNGDSIAVQDLMINDLNLPIRVLQSKEYVEIKNIDQFTDQWLTLKTEEGGFFKLILADGSTVYLNANSELRYQSNFLNNRVIHVKGEAFFEVKKMLDSNKQLQPFTVLGGNHQIQVLGTQFDFKNDEGKPTRTTLVTGSVAVQDVTTGAKKIIKPGQQALSTQTGDIQLQEVDVEQYSAWKDGFYYFKDQPLVNILSQLQDNFDFNFDKKHIPHITMTLIVKKNRSLSEILTLIEKSSDLALYFKGGNLKIKP